MGSNEMDECTTFLTLLRTCTKNKDLCRGLKLHDSILKRGFVEKYSDALVTMYAKCGDLVKAEELFHAHKSRDVFTWTALMAGYAQKGQCQDALTLFELMQHEGLSPDAVTYSCILKACSILRAANMGEKVHDNIVKQGLLRNNIVVGNALVNMYAKCGSLTKARQVLEELPIRNAVTWTSLIVGYTEHGEGEQALDCFEQMQGEGLSPDATTYACALKACGSIRAAKRGEQLHDEITKQELLGENSTLHTALVDMYAKCGALAKAHRLLKEFPVRSITTWNALLAGYVEHGEAEQAFQCFKLIQQHDRFSPNAVTYACILKACGTARKLDEGCKIHEEIAKKGLLILKDIVLGNALVDMYAKCGALVKAQQVLEGLPVRNVVSWTALIAGCAEHGAGDQALSLYEQMQCEGLSPNAASFVCILKACGSIGAIETGATIHNNIAKRGLLRNNNAFGTALVDMYAKCGAFERARQVIEELDIRDVSAWTALIDGYAEHGEVEEALECYKWMQHEGLSPDAITFACVLKAYGSLKAIYKVELIRDEIAKQDFFGNVALLGSALVETYVKCGALDKARQVLEELPAREVPTWTALMMGYVENGNCDEALGCFQRMLCDGLSPDAVTFICVLKACGSMRALDKGVEIHEKVFKQGLLGSDIMLGTALVDMYAKCGALEEARVALEELPIRDVSMWTALIAGYVEHGHGQGALDCFEQMLEEGLHPDSITFVCILKACGSLREADKGKDIHDKISKQGLLGKNLMLGTAVVDMYAKCGALQRAQQVLEELPARNISSWNALIAGYGEHGEGARALHCYRQMQSEGLSPDDVTYICVLKACGYVGLADEGERIHVKISEQGLLASNIVLGNALVDMHVKCGALAKARKVLEQLPTRNVTTWNVLIAGHVRHEEGAHAMECFEQMQREGLSPDAGTFACVLKACGSTGAIDKGEKIHDEIAEHGWLATNTVLGTALVDMYAKCGALAKAHQVLEELSLQNVLAWNALIGGYIQRGAGTQALDCFKQMQHAGVFPNVATFSCVLTACSRLGLVEDAHGCFVTMNTKYSVTPDTDHFNCMVDLLGRAGHLERAIGVIEKMSSSTRVVWSSLLGACLKWVDVKVASWAFENALSVDKNDAAIYIIMGKIYTAAGMTREAQIIEDIRHKNQACQKKLNKFKAQRNDIFMTVKSLRNSGIGTSL